MGKSRCDCRRKSPTTRTLLEEAKISAFRSRAAHSQGVEKVAVRCLGCLGLGFKVKEVEGRGLELKVSGV